MANLLHIKGTRTQIYKTLPSNSVGNDGDIILSQIQGRGVYLCSKVNGRWHVSNKMEELRKIEKTSIKDLKLDRLKISNTTITKDEYDVSSGDLALDIAGDIELNADGGQVTIKDDSASHFLFDCDNTQFKIYDDTDAADFFTITVGASGITTLATVDDGAAVGHLTLDPDGELNLTPTTEVKSDAPLKIKEASAAVADTAAYGQLWVKTATPNELYFTTDAGNDIQITSGTALIGDITGVTLTGDSGGALSDTSGSADFTIAGGTNATSAGSGSTITLNVDDAFIVNNAADIMAVSDFGANAALKIDADQPATAGAEDSVGLWIDYDRIVAGSGTAVHNDIGIDLDVNAASLGTSFVKGMDIDVVGAASGTHVATGIDINVSGADKNYGLDITTSNAHIRLFASADVDDYATFILADTGDLSIATVGDGTTDSDLILDIDGSIILDSADGGFIAKKAGTEFSATDSAYAGMILGYTRIQDDDTDSGDDYITVNSSAMTVLQTVAGTNLSIQFIVPPSGNVEIECSFFVQATSDGAKFSLSTGTSYSELNEKHTYDADWTFYLDETDHLVENIRFSVTGLTAGTDTTYYLAGLASGAGVSIRHGRYRTGGTHSPPIILKAIALPATIVEGE